MMINLCKWNKRMPVLLGVCAIMFTGVTRVNAEDINEYDQPAAPYYMENGIKAAYHNMHIVYESYTDEEGNLLKQAAGHVAVEQVWDGNDLVSRTYLGADGKPVNRIDGYSKAVWEENKSGSRNMVFYDVDGNEVDSEGLNLVNGVEITSDGWSEWMTPEYNAENYIINVGNYNLGACKKGDKFSFQFAVEFADVKSTDNSPFAFMTVGAVNGKWDHWAQKNAWNSSLANIEFIPLNKIYVFTKTVEVSDEMANAGKCRIGFRCDYWSEGRFRVRDVKIEKGDSATKWSPGV